MSIILSIGTSNPPFVVPQSTILGFMQHAYANETLSRKLSILFNSSGIQSRHSAIPDFDCGEHEESIFSGNDQPGIESRLRLFKERAVPLALKAISNAISDAGDEFSLQHITHLITVSCTGLYSPGMDAALVRELNLSPDTFHTAFNFLGCNAAFPAMNMADKIARTTENACVLVVCTELCTLHFQAKDNHDNLLSNTLFGDGAAAILISAQHEKRLTRPHLQIKGFCSRLLSEGENLMGWNINARNFEMILNSCIPTFLSGHIQEFIDYVEKTFEIDHNLINHWAVHPGGRKILDLLKNTLKHPLTESFKTLEDFGNMSSPTILFVLQKILKTDIEPGSPVMAIGFGPGVSMDAMLMNYA